MMRDRLKFRNWKLVNKLLVCFLGVAVPPLVVLALTQYQESAKYLFSMEETSLSLHAKIIAEQVDLYFTEMKNHLLSLAMNREIVDFLSRDERTDLDVNRLNVFLDRLQGISTEEYSAIFVLDVHGVCLASTDRRFITTDYGFRSYAAEIIRKGHKLHISNFCIGLRSLVPGVFISAPVYGRDGKMIGIAVLKVAGTAIWRLVENFRPPKGEPVASGSDGFGRLLRFLLPRAGEFGSFPEASIVNEDGIIISHPDQAYLYKSLDDLETGVLRAILESRQFLDLDIGSLKNSFLMDLHARSGKTASPLAATYMFNDEVRVAAIAPLKTKAWTVGVSVSYRQFTYLSRMLFFKLVTVVLVIVLGLFFLTFLMSRLVNKPMDSLIAVMGRVKAGERNARVAITRKDEFGVLADRFNELLDIIEDYSKNLEAKVMSRTDEIARLQQENLRLRIIEEKERIFADLHDSIGARLTNIFICNNVAMSVEGKDPAAVREMIGKIDENCESAIRDLKEIVRGKHFAPTKPARSEIEDDLLPRIRERLLLKNIAFVCNLENRNGQEPLDGELSEEITLICDELVSNVLRYAGASRVVLDIELEEKALRLRFTDDGRGFKPKDARKRGFGLSNLSRRIGRLGGRLRISSVPGRGAAFFIFLPRRTEP